MVLLLGACASNDEKMQSIDPKGSAAQLNDLHETNDGIKKISSDTTQKPVVDLNAVLEREMISPDAKQAVIAMKNGDYVDASKLFNTALLASPSDSYLHFLNGLNYLHMAQQGNANAKEMAITGFLYAVTYDSSNVMAHNRLAYIYFQNKDYAKSQRHFAMVLLLQDPDVKSLYAMAAASYYNHDLKTAYASITQAASLEPNNIVVLRAASMIAAALNQPLEAQQFRKRYLEAAKKTDKPLDTRLRNWMSVHNTPGLILTAAEGPAGDEGAQPQGDDGQAQQEAGSSQDAQQVSGADNAQFAAPLPDPNMAPPAPMVNPDGSPVAQKLGEINPNQPDTFVIDCAIMRVSESGKTSKGSNILDTIAVAFNPGSYTRNHTWGRGRGSNGSTNTTSTVKNEITFSPMNNAGSAVQYSLNIFNVTDTRLEVVSRPTLLAALGKTSEFFAGTDLVAGIAGGLASSLEKIPVGYRVTVTPIGSRKDKNGVLKVQFDVRVEGNSIGSLSASVTSGSFSEINHSFVSTTVEMAFGETVILAGIYDRSDNSSSSYTPVLGQIPGLGIFFSRDTTDSVRKSVVYMMTLRRSDSQMEDANSLNDDKRLSPEVKELQMRNLTWFSTVPNSALVMKGLSRLYREFRSGDIPNINWWHSDMGQQDLYCHDNEISEAVKMLAS